MRRWVRSGLAVLIGLALSIFSSAPRPSFWPHVRMLRDVTDEEVVGGIRSIPTHYATNSLISIATGFFTAASTWGLCDPTSELDSEAASTATTTSFVASQTFTTGGITANAIAIKIAARAANPTGTFTIELYNSTLSASVANTSTTINVTDMDASGLGWYVFPTTGNVTLVGATGYQVRVKSSVAGEVTLYRDGTAGNWSRQVRTTTTQAPTGGAGAGAAGDKLIMAGEHTGAGTGNSFTITLDNTSTNSFGPTVSGGPPDGVSVNKRAAFACQNNGNTNYYFRWKGRFNVYGGGTFFKGPASGNMVSTSTVVYEMDSVVNVDTGIVENNGGAVTGRGNPNVTSTSYQTKLTSDIGGICSTTNVANSIVTGSIGQSFTGLTGTIAINGVNYTISSVQSATQLTLTSNAGAQTNVNWTHAGTANVLKVLDTTGWATGDIGCIACTGRTSTECESWTILTVDSATQVTLTTPLVKPHSGTQVQTLVAIGTPTGGTFTLTYGGQTTGTLNWNCAASDVKTALELLGAIGSGNTTCTGGPLPGSAINIVLANSLAVYTVPPITANGANLTGAAGAVPTPNVTVALFDTRAEVGHLTRNVKVRGISTSLQGYVQLGVDGTAGSMTFDCQYVEFYQLGSNTSGKKGIGLSVTTGSANLQYCSIHDFIVTNSTGIFINNGSGNNMTISSNVFYNVNARSLYVVTATAGTAWTMSGNLCMLNVSNVPLYDIADVGGTFTSNTAVGSTGNGMTISESNAITGTFSGLVAHGNASVGIQVTNCYSGTVSTCIAWRNSTRGFSVGAQCKMVIDTISFFGNATSGIIPQSGIISNQLVVKSATINSKASAADPFTQPRGIELANTSGTVFISAVVGIAYTHSTADVTSGSFGIVGDLENCLFGSPIFLSSQSSLYPSSRIGSERHQQTAGNHLTAKGEGTLLIDTNIFATASPSLRMVPLSAANKLDSRGRTGWLVPVANGVAPTVTVKVRESVAADALGTCNTVGTAVTWVSGAQKFSGMTGSITINSVAYTISSVTDDTHLTLTGSAGTQNGVNFGQAYNGNKVRLLVARNAALEINADTVLATATGADVGAFQVLTGTPAIPNDGGALEFFVDCDGTTGAVNVDDFAVTVISTNKSTKGMNYWLSGTPLIAADISGGGPPPPVLGFGPQTYGD